MQGSINPRIYQLGGLNRLNTSHSTKCFCDSSISSCSFTEICVFELIRSTWQIALLTMPSKWRSLHVTCVLLAIVFGGGSGVYFSIDVSVSGGNTYGSGTGSMSTGTKGT